MSEYEPCSERGHLDQFMSKWLPEMKITSIECAVCGKTISPSISACKR